jgi:hypothetical protein
LGNLKIIEHKTNRVTDSGCEIYTKTFVMHELSLIISKMLFVGNHFLSFFSQGTIKLVYKNGSYSVFQTRGNSVENVQKVYNQKNTLWKLVDEKGE